MTVKIERSETDLRTWSTQALKKRAVSVYSAVYQTECFATHDLLELDALQAELNRRGYEFEESKYLSIVKKG